MFETTNPVLVPALEVAVSLFVWQFQEQGGITDEDIARVQFYLPDLLVHGDDLFFRSRKKGETAKRFNQVAEIIAVLSFAPGGITIFGLHFESHMPDVF
jgi:hypothetical protein